VTSVVLLLFLYSIKFVRFIYVHKWFNYRKAANVVIVSKKGEKKNYTCIISRFSKFPVKYMNESSESSML